MKQNSLYDPGIIYKEYVISFKQYLLTKKFTVSATIYEKELNFSADDEQEISVYGFAIKSILSQRYIRLRAYKYIEQCNLFIFQVIPESGNNLKFLKIADIAIASKFRGKGIGTQLLKIIEKVAHEKQCVYIVGELEEDRIGEPLDKRKKFFARNGFDIWLDKRAEFSGWVIKKELKAY